MTAFAASCAPRDAADEAAADLRVLDRMALAVAPNWDGGDFFVDRFEVTNAEYARFLEESGWRPADAEGFLRRFADPAAGAFDPRLAEHPVVFVSHDDALAYSRWAGKELPTAEEWTLVASAVWVGDRPVSRFNLNVRETELGTTTRVGTFESGRTRGGSTLHPPVYDLFGNAWEWTATPDGGGRGFVIKGSSFNEFLEVASVFRNDRAEEAWNRRFDLGFRCVVRDADRRIGDLLGRIAGLRTGARIEAYSALARFGEPMVRLVQSLRFRDAQHALLQGGDRDADRLLSVGRGGLAVVGASGSVDLFAPEGGPSRARAALGAEVYQARAADLDGDGSRELLVALREDHTVVAGGANGAEPRVLAPLTGFVLAGEAQAGLSLHPLDGGAAIPWRDWIIADGARTLEALGLLHGREAFMRGLPADALDLALAPPGRALPLGFVPRIEQRLVCLDGETLAERWSRKTLYSELVQPVSGRGLVVVPGLWWVQGESGAPLEAQVLDVVVLDARGGPVARGRLPGGCRSLALLDDDPVRLLVVTASGNALVLAIAGERLVLERDLDPGGTRAFLGVQRGPLPSRAVLTSRDDAPGRAGMFRIECLDAAGDTLAATELALPADPQVYVADEDGGVLVRPRDQGLARYVIGAGRLVEAWRRGDDAGEDLLRRLAVRVDVDRDGRHELAVARGFSDVVVLDLASGETRVTFGLPGANLLRLGRMGDRLLASYRDRGTFVLEARDTPRERAAREFLERAATAPPP